MTEQINTGDNVTETKAAPEGHDAAMAARYEAEQTVKVGTVTNPTPQEQTPERPAWLPEKFKTVNDFVKSYGELEKKLGQPTAEKPAEKPATEKADNPLGIKPEDAAAFDAMTPEERAQGAVAEAGLKYDELVKEFSQAGVLSDETYQRLEKAGITRDMVTDHIEGQIARAAFHRQAVLSEIGGEAKFTEMAQWAAANLPKADLDAYNAAVEGGLASQKMAVAALYQKFTAANGSEPSLVGGSQTGDGLAPFRSDAEVVQAMSDPRYQMDDAYRKDVMTRLSRSNVF